MAITESLTKNIAFGLIVKAGHDPLLWIGFGSTGSGATWTPAAVFNKSSDIPMSELSIKDNGDEAAITAAARLDDQLGGGAIDFQITAECKGVDRS